MITAIYASLLTLWFVSVNARYRITRQSNVHFSTWGPPDDMLERAVRAHGNLAEYTPIMLILLTC